MSEAGPGEVTLLLLSWTGGNRTALDDLMALVYPELRRLAAGYLRRERRGHTLRATALVHEAYLRLVDQTQVDSHCRSQFFAIAANLMRQILVNHADRYHAAKRGGGNRVTLEDNMALTLEPPIDLLALDEALTSLEKFDPRQSRIVELRFFGGLTEEEIAEVMHIPLRTIQREWRTARALLYRQLRRPASK